MTTVSPLESDFLQHQILSRVNKPGRYLGIEFGAYRKDPAQAKVRMAMLFPDLYEIGVSNYGHKLLYSHVNNQADYLCDRAYAPAQDMRALLKETGTPLYGIETLIPLKQFDLLAFTLQYELNYTTILGILEAAYIPFRTENRSDDMPILIAGGPGSANPIPLAPFFDAFILGDGEDVLLEVLDCLKEAKQYAWTNAQTRQQLSQLEGVYVPGISQSARKRIVDISQQTIELAPLVPYIQTVHDRVTVEARRGCDRMCRFCQPCFINLPVREQNVDTLKNQALKEIAKTGYEECSLLSLSIADYSQLKPLIHTVSDALNEKGVSLSLPSQRADRFDIEVAEAVQQVRKSTLTFAPEAGTERLRRVLNKNLTETEILDAVTSSYQAGWNKVKLYFMLGVPTETDVDLLGIRDLVRKMQDLCAQMRRERQKSFKSVLEVNVTLSNFVPKPHTPFQWAAQDSMAELRRKRQFLKEAFQGMKGIKLNFTDPEISKLEAVISKGDIRMADVIEKAYARGAYLDAWDENFEFPEWFASLQEMGIDPDHFTAKTYTRLDEPLPWDGIDVGLERQWLVDEYRKSLTEASSDPCFIGCSTCGVCTGLNVMPVFIKPSQVAHLPERQTPKVLAKTERYPLPKAKARLMLEKKGSLRFISHLDWLRMLQRAIFRAQLPIAYSQGFNPTPRMSFGPALPLFTEGEAEYLDLEMLTEMPSLMTILNTHLPEDGKVLSCTWVALNTPSLDKQLKYVTYTARWTCSFGASEYTLGDRIQMVSTLSDWIVEVATRKGSSRKEAPQGTPGQQIDIKPFIRNLTVTSSEDVVFSILIDRTQPQIKPQWLLNLLMPQATWEIRRLKVGLDPLESVIRINETR